MRSAWRRLWGRTISKRELEYWRWHKGSDNLILAAVGGNNISIVLKLDLRNICLLNWDFLKTRGQHGITASFDIRLTLLPTLLLHLSWQKRYPIKEPELAVSG